MRSQRNICEPIAIDGRFVSLPTFELSAREGHANIVADSWELPIEIADQIGARGIHGKGPRYPIGELADLCPAGRAVLIPHHPNTDSVSRARLGSGRPQPAAARCLPLRSGASSRRTLRPALADLGRSGRMSNGKTKPGRSIR